MFKKLYVENFTAIGGAEFRFSSGINVFLGENGTGKTHILKLLYCLESYYTPDAAARLGSTGTGEVLPVMIGEKLAAVFRPDGGKIDRLVRRSPDAITAVIDAEFDKGRLAFMLDKNGFCDAIRDSRDPAYTPSSIFLPAREVLSLFPGFISASADRELASDETQYDLCIALDRPTLQGPGAEEAVGLWQPLANALQATIQREGPRFYLTSEADGKVEAHLVAEGARKIASLMHLIANGSIAKGGLLFWDEPETNLNPKLIKVVADFLLNIAAQGVQVFIASHDYLLTNELSLQAEYRTKASQDAPIRFFGFYRGDDHAVSVQAGETLADLDHNPIMDEFGAHYQREVRLFAGGGTPQ